MIWSTSSSSDRPWLHVSGWKGGTEDLGDGSVVWASRAGLSLVLGRVDVVLIVCEDGTCKIDNLDQTQSLLWTVEAQSYAVLAQDHEDRLCDGIGGRVGDCTRRPGQPQFLQLR